MPANVSPADILTIGQVAEALRSRDPRKAAALAEAAMAGGLRHPILYNARALWLGEQGRHEDALADFKRSEAMSQPTAATKNAIALCLAKLGRHGEAVRTFDEAIALQPSVAEYHYRKGWVHELAGDLDPARRALESAVALQPEYAEALARLAFLSARVGRWDDAKETAGRALARDRSFTAAQLALAMCALEDDEIDAAQGRLDAVLNDKRAGVTDRYLALGLMGDLLDKQDRVAEAFAFYRRAKELLPTTDPGGTQTMYDVTSALCGYFENLAPPPPAKGTPDRELPHIFLLGFLRSGTTLLEQVLASHEAVGFLEEKDTLADAVRSFMAQPENLDRLWTAGEQTLAEHRQAYWRRVRDFGLEPDGKAVVDKMPINTVKIPVISRLFPHATILFAVRDPRDVVLSCFRRSFNFNATTADFATLQSTARFYDAVMRLAEICRDKLSPKLYQLRLEDLVDDFEGQVRALCDAVGLPWSDRMRQFAELARARAIATPSATQIIRGINRRGIGQWRRYRDQMGPVLPLLTPWVRRFGYAED